MLGIAVKMYGYDRILVNCDDDNWFEANHVESLLESIGSYQWAYSLRNIAYGRCIVRDVCESLGYLHPVWNSPKEHHIDTNCYFLPKKVALHASSFWCKKEDSRENDRQFYWALQKLFPRYTCTKEHTVNYNIHQKYLRFFLKGTKWMRQRYGKIMPWERTVSK